MQNGTAQPQHVPHPGSTGRARTPPHTIKAEHTGLNGKIAVAITNMVGSMWCAYAFAALALISLPDAIKDGREALIAWIAQTFLQLVLLSVIMVGQKVAAAASDKQALQTYRDAETLLKIQDKLQQLVEINNALTAEIHAVVTATPPKAASPAE